MKAVAATLTLPILLDGNVGGTVNLYAASGGAFGGLHEQLAAIFDAWAPGAVTNADLSFRTRQTAEQAVEVMQASMREQIAIGVLMSAQSLDSEIARNLLHQAAQRAGVPPDQFAETLLEVYRNGDSRTSSPEDG